MCCRGGWETWTLILQVTDHPHPHIGHCIHPGLRFCIHNKLIRLTRLACIGPDLFGPSPYFFLPRLSLPSYFLPLPPCYLLLTFPPSYFIFDC